MEFSKGVAGLRAELCRESVYGAAATATAARDALRKFRAATPSAPRVEVPLIDAYRLAVAAGLDPPPERRCRFTRMSEAAAWTDGPLAPLHRLLKARYRFVPYDEYLAGVHRTADALGRALERLPRGRVALYVLGGRPTGYGLLKSNVWVFFLMARRLEAANPAAFARLAGATTCCAGVRPRGDVAAVVHVDDALYSGEQLINGMLDDDPCAGARSQGRGHATLIAVPFATTFALAALRKLARATACRVIGRPEPIPSAFDGPGLTVAQVLRAVPDQYGGVRPFSCTTVFEHKVADGLSLPPAFGRASRKQDVRFARPATPEIGATPYRPKARHRTVPGRLVTLPRLPPLFNFGPCRTGHYTELLRGVFGKLRLDEGGGTPP